MVTRKDKTKKLSFSLSWDELNLKDIFKLISASATIISALLIYFHFDSKSVQTEIKATQDSVVVAFKDTTKTPRGVLSAKMEKALSNDSMMIVLLKKMDKRDSMITSYIENLTRADAQIASNGIAMHEKDSARIDLVFHTLAELLPVIKKKK